MYTQVFKKPQSKTAHGTGSRDVNKTLLLRAVQLKAREEVVSRRTSDALGIPPDMPFCTKEEGKRNLLCSTANSHAGAIIDTTGGFHRYCFGVCFVETHH